MPESDKFGTFLVVADACCQLFSGDECVEMVCQSRTYHDSESVRRGFIEGITDPDDDAVADIGEGSILSLLIRPGRVTLGASGVIRVLDVRHTPTGGVQNTRIEYECIEFIDNLKRNQNV